MTYPPAPLFAPLIVGYVCAYEERGAYGFLTVCLPGCSDGFARMDHAIETQIPSYNPLAKPIAIPLASCLLPLTSFTQHPRLNVGAFKIQAIHDHLDLIVRFEIIGRRIMRAHVAHQPPAAGRHAR